MTMTPYLQAVTADSVYVLVESDAKDPVTVEYGRTKSVSGARPSRKARRPPRPPRLTYVHNIKLTGLKPNTWYYYRVSQGAARSEVHTFVTAAEPGTQLSFRLDGRLPLGPGRA